MSEPTPQKNTWSDSDIEQFRKMIGGKRDMIDGAVPAIIFVAANALWSLALAAILAAAYSVGATLYRVVRKEEIKRSLIGLVGLGLAVGLALFTKSASAYFVPGVITGALFGVLTLLTVALKQPTSAIFAAALERKPAEHYQRPEILRAHMIVTTFWGVVFLARAALRAYLIASDQPELLGASAIVLGYPVTLGLAAASVFYLRRRNAALAPIEVSEEPS